MPSASLLSLAVILGAVACDPEAREAEENVEPAEFDIQVTVMPRTPELREFPCVEQCHVDLEVNSNVRQLELFHTRRGVVHGETMFWCTFCHDAKNLDQLTLQDGTHVTFDDSHRLCGQCHGDKRRDWSNGVHGLQSGQWNGAIVRRNCPVCHDPHAPRRPTFTALPPPQPPRGQDVALGHQEEPGHE